MNIFAGPANFGYIFHDMEVVKGLFTYLSSKVLSDLNKNWLRPHRKLIVIVKDLIIIGNRLIMARNMSRSGSFCFNSLDGISRFFKHFLSSDRVRISACHLWFFLIPRSGRWLTARDKLRYCQHTPS